MNHITLDQANKVIEGAFAKAKELHLKPLGVVVLDAGGHPIAFQRRDGASTGRLQIATGKAAGALFLGLSSRKVGDRKSVVSGKSVSERVDLGGRRTLKKQKTHDICEELERHKRTEEVNKGLKRKI